MNTDYPKKVNYQDYEHAFNNYWLKKFVEGQLRFFDTENMRGLIYGYTFTEDYAKGIIPDILSAEYWKQKHKDRFSGSQRLTCPQLSLSEYLGQEGLICEAIKSTGDGTLDNPYCVICVEHEYETLKSLSPVITIKRQTLLPGYIDCFECEEYGIPHVEYFDISRWFERVKLF